MTKKEVLEEIVRMKGQCGNGVHEDMCEHCPNVCKEAARKMMDECFIDTNQFLRKMEKIAKELLDK